MATAYTEFNVAGASLLSTIQTAILASTDWARPNSGTYPTLFKATTTRGAQMAIDINTVAADLNKMTMAAYRTHDGTTAGDSAATFLRHKRTTGGAFATNIYHGIVSAGKEHLFISMEGPRAGETGPDNASYGSIRNYVFLNDLVPYHAGDTIPVVILGGPPTNVAPSLLANAHQVRVSRNGADNASWNPGHLTALSYPFYNAQQGQGFFFNEQRVATLDSSTYYLSPFVFFDNNEGERGRLASFFYAGMNQWDQYEAPAPPVGQIVTYAGASYKLLQINKSDGSELAFGGFGAAYNSTAALVNNSVVVAVPYA